LAPNEILLNETLTGVQPGGGFAIARAIGLGAILQLEFYNIVTPVCMVGN
jgi:hypothetical protein